MSDLDLSSKTVLITGALGALAEHMVKRLSAAGATLLLTDAQTEAEALRTLARWQIPPSRSVYRQMDITDRQAVETVLAELLEQFPALDTVLGHAGGCALHPFLETDQKEFDRIFAFNYFGQVYLARAVLTAWRRAGTQGHLIFTTSYVACVPHTRIAAYATAKAALEHLTRCLALEVAPLGIRVNALAPGNVAAGSSLKVFEEDAEYREFVRRVSPLGQRNSPEAIADVFLFLTSELAREMTGQVIRVDMGVTIPKIG